MPITVFGLILDCGVQLSKITDERLKLLTLCYLNKKLQVKHLLDVRMTNYFEKQR